LARDFTAHTAVRDMGDMVARLIDDRKGQQERIILLQIALQLGYVSSLSWLKAGTSKILQKTEVSGMQMVKPLLP